MNFANHNYWEDRAKKYYGHPETMTSNDPLLAQLEIKALLEYFNTLPNDQRILEVGCGSGRIVEQLALQYPNYNWHGIDFAETMILQAKELNIPRSIFEVGDILTWKSPESVLFNTIYLVRALSNLSSNDEQLAALEHLQSLLYPHSGSLVMLEPTLQGLESLNKIRSQFDLESIKSPSFNHYIDLKKVVDKLGIWFSNVQVRQFSAGYCLASRVLNAVLARKEGRKVSYLDPLNKIGASMDQSISNISTHIMIIASR